MRNAYVLGAVLCCRVWVGVDVLCCWLVVHSPQTSSALFFKYNTSLGPPFHIIIDTNFINFSIQNKLDIMRSMMDCLLAKCECRRAAAHPLLTCDADCARTL